jgi:hypothetical protein
VQRHPARGRCNGKGGGPLCIIGVDDQLDAARLK